jgi:N-methylhydantoinase B
MSAPTVTWDGVKDAYVPPADLRERVAGKVKLHDEASEELDPVTYEVIRHNLWIVNTEHGETMTRLSGSPSANIAQDFNPVILLEDGEELFFGPYIQHAAAACGSAVKWILENRSENPGIAEGDVFIENDPWIGCNHQPDIGVLTPVFHGDEIFCWVANTLHVYDLGGSTPGSFCPDVVDVFSEPAPIPPVKIVEAGVIRRDIEELYVRHSRAPELVALDVHAVIAGTVIAARRIKELIDRYGAPVVKAAMRKVVDDAEDAFSSRIEEIPDGVWTDVGYLEEKSVGDRHAHKMVLSVEKRGGKLIFRNDGTDPQVAGSLNCTLIGWKGAITAALTPIFGYDQLFAIGGALRHCEFEPTPKTLTCASYPAAVSCAPGYAIVYTVVQAQRVLSKMGYPSEKIRPELGPGGMSSWPLAALSGRDTRGNEIATVVIDEVAGGMSAYPWRDGLSAGGHSWIPLGKQPNIENNEYFFPILYLYRKLVPSSGGAGKYRGGNTFASCYVSHEAEELAINTISTGQGVPSGPGIYGGLPAMQTRHLLRRDSDVLEQFEAGTMPRDITELAGDDDFLKGKSRDNVLGPADVYEQRPCAAAGYGDPLDRDPQNVVDDLEEGEIDLPIASEVYGVVLDAESFEVDFEATSALRAEMRDGRAAEAVAGPQLRSGGAGALPADDALPIHEYLVIDSGCIRCRKCGQDYGPADGNYKLGTLWRELEIRDIAPGFNDRSRYVDDEVVLRECICPGCKTLLESEVTMRGSDPVHDIKINGSAIRPRAETDTHGIPG